MRLRIAGINHFDVLGRSELGQWLAQYANEQPGPSFLAAEWDQAIFERVRDQRTHFRGLIAARWPGFSNDMLTTLEMSLAYEADSHLLLYPDLNILWLDARRDANQVDVDQFAEDRLARYAELVGNDLNLENEQQVLTAMSEAADARFGGGVADPRRDRRFVARIVRQARDDEWAFVIVGRHHAADVEGSMRCLLEERDHVCEVTQL
jgi:hypothetical protein